MELDSSCATLGLNLWVSWVADSARVFAQCLVIVIVKFVNEKVEI